jgi:hypothetical protein
MVELACHPSNDRKRKIGGLQSSQNWEKSEILSPK